MKRTPRGFHIHRFKDRNGVTCSLQKSSLADAECVWLGCDDADPKVLIHGQGWTPIAWPDNCLANTRMHLTRKQVARLIPLLQAFVDTGDIAMQKIASGDGFYGKQAGEYKEIARAALAKEEEPE